MNLCLTEAHAFLHGLSNAFKHIMFLNIATKFPLDPLIIPNIYQDLAARKKKIL